MTLRLQIEEAEKKLHQLRTSSDSSWSIMRTELEEPLSNFSNAINQRLAVGSRIETIASPLDFWRE
jgi:hypothetical protein